jgi:predicted ATPase
VKPTALLFSRYRAFREFTRLELAPLTIIIGKNGGGKSVLTRLPLLLASGLAAQAEGPLDLNAGGVSHAARFEDLIYQRSAQPFCLGAEISGEGRTLRFVTTLRHIVERHELAIEAFELIDGDQRVVNLKAARPEDIGNPTGAFLAQFGADPTEHEVRIRIVGLFPTEIEGYADVSAQLGERRVQFEKAFAAPSYLGPFRSELGALPRIPRQGVRDLGPRGERALDILGDDGLRGDGQLVQAVEDWFENAMEGNRVKLERAGDFPRLLVHDPMRNVDLDICDTGAGFAQVLPVVVQAFARRMDRICSPIVIVEQPELHLHPAAHGNLADLIGETAAAVCARACYICETHSEQLITRLRRRIAERPEYAEVVKIVSVGHQSAIGADVEPIRTIGLDSFGSPDAWPIGVFDEAFEDLKHLKEAVQKRLAEEARHEA